MLKYIGQGGFIPDLNGELVPSRDLTDAEVKHFGEASLLASGLYAKSGEAKKKITQSGHEDAPQFEVKEK